MCLGTEGGELTHARLARLMADVIFAPMECDIIHHPREIL
jgi:hypothetical protein